MLTYEEALRRVLEKTPGPRVECVSVQESLGRALATPVLADVDLPPFRKSFVDGYALRSQDVKQTPVRLRVVGSVSAGSQQQPRIEKDQAVQIMTGAVVPPGADCVQMVERTRRHSEESVEILESVKCGANVAPKGHEVQKGASVLQAGRTIGPKEIGVLATFGCASVDVFTAPTAVVLSTGDELVEINQQPGFAQIRNSNAYMLWAQCRRLGLEATIRPPLPDDREKTREAIRSALKYDLLLLSGGVSMGEHDYVHQVLSEEKTDIFFHKAAIKPGKPLLVGRKDESMIFGLPGNPVSALVTFELFVRPAVRRWMGLRDCTLPHIKGKLLRSVTRKPGRKLFKPCRIRFQETSFQVEPIDTRGSADLVAFSQANSLMVIEADMDHLNAGESVEIILLEDYFEDQE